MCQGVGVCLPTRNGCLCIMFRVVKWDVLEIILPGGTNKCILLCELFQDFLEFVVMYKTAMPSVNGMKYVQREGFKNLINFLMIRVFSMASGSFNVGGGVVS